MSKRPLIVLLAAGAAAVTISVKLGIQVDWRTGLFAFGWASFGAASVYEIMSK